MTKKLKDNSIARFKQKLIKLFGFDFCWCTFTILLVRICTIFKFWNESTTFFLTFKRKKNYTHKHEDFKKANAYLEII